MKFKKLFAGMMAFLMSVSLTTTNVNAKVASEGDAELEEIIDEDEELVLGYDEASNLIIKEGFLASEDSVAKNVNHSYDQKIIDALNAIEASVDIEGAGIKKDEIADYLTELVNNNPQIFYYDGCTYKYNSSTGIVKTIEFNYTGSVETVFLKKIELEREVSKMLADIDLSGLSEVEKALAVYDYICINTEYDVKGLLTNNYAPDVFNAYGLFVNHKAVCRGYAEAYKLLMDRLGIKCGFAASARLNHVWNVVDIDGKWYHVDPTWGCPSPSDENYTGSKDAARIDSNNFYGKMTRYWFMTSTAQMLAIENKLNGSTPKDDFKIAVDYRFGTFDGAASTKYDKGAFWEDISSQMYPYKGDFYYLEPVYSRVTEGDYSSDWECQLVKSNYKTGSKTSLLSWDAYFIDTNGWKYSNGKECRAFCYKNYIFFDTSQEIKRYDIDTGEVVVVQSNVNKDGQYYIYNIGRRDDRLIYTKLAVKKYNVDIFTPVTFVTNCENHTYEEQLRIEPTLSSDGFLSEKCFVCGKTEEITLKPYVEAKDIHVISDDNEKINVEINYKATEGLDIEFAWYLLDQTGEQKCIQDWSSTAAAVTWAKNTYGAVTITAKVRIKGTTDVQEVKYTFESHPAIKGNCQMPYAMIEPGAPGYLIGLEVFPESAEKVEMLILDCTSMQWVYTTTPCGIADNCLWTVWQPEYGYYWTLFRAYDKAGNIIDEVCYGFVNVV